MATFRNGSPSSETAGSRHPSTGWKSWKLAADEPPCASNLRFQRVSRVSFVTSPSRVSRKPLRLHNPALSFTLFTITTKKKLDLNHGLSHRIQEYQPYSPLTGRNIHRTLHRSKKITIASSVIRQKYQPRRSFVNRSKC